MLAGEAAFSMRKTAGCRSEVPGLGNVPRIASGSRIILAGDYCSEGKSKTFVQNAFKGELPECFHVFDLEKILHFGRRSIGHVLQGLYYTPNFRRPLLE
jgi:hypothetical protein